MAGIARGIRFLIGLAMVAGGATLAAPVAVRLANIAAVHFGGSAAALPAAPTPMPQMPPPPSPPTLSVGPVDPTAASGVPNNTVPHAGGGIRVDAAAPVLAGGEAAAPPSLDREYRPPAPPLPLPTLPAEFVMPGPQVANAYRSTLDVPPPPLLDSQQPPPLAAAWSAHSVAHPPAQMQPAVDVPQTYRVRDGDDLTSIATRFYGHSGAAAAIWDANRGTISDPTLLPINVELRLPPTSTGASMPSAAATGRAIEPPTTNGGVVSGPAATAVSWLGSGAAGPAQSLPSPPPRQVRVGPGETLTSLAKRFYGDAAQANRIWEANRDQLRSPELVVAGMELKLP
jgi:nucleoid-associated protein YgaU